MWRDRRKIEIALKLLTNFLTTAYRAAMRSRNFVAGVSHPAHNVENGGSSLCDGVPNFDFLRNHQPCKIMFALRFPH